MKTIAFFNSKGSATGSTWGVAMSPPPQYRLDTAVYRVGMVGIGPEGFQTLLTAMFLDAERLESLWPDTDHPDTVYGSIQPILRGR